MIFIDIFILILLALILFDIYLFIKPKTKLKILPLEYKFSSKDNKTEELDFIFKIINLSQNKETMISDLNFFLDLFNQKDLTKFDYKQNIVIDDGINMKDFKNYWETIIIKSKSEIKVSIKITYDKNLLNNINFIWFKLNWENYGHFGLVKKQDCYLLNRNIKNRKRRREIINIPIGNKYETIAIKTDLLGALDNPIETVALYCKDIIKKNDILVIGETPLAIMQGRYISPQNIEYNFISKLLCYFFHPTSSLATACGMQLLINKVGITRIITSLVIGFLFKILGIKGIFYRLAGYESSLIDDISGTTAPYDKTIVMGPRDPDLYCNEICKLLKIESAVVDVNDLGKVKIIASSSKSIINILKKALSTNPAGNDDQKTPILLIREKQN